MKKPHTEDTERGFDYHIEPCLFFQRGDENRITSLLFALAIWNADLSRKFWWHKFIILTTGVFLGVCGWYYSKQTICDLPSRNHFKEKTLASTTRFVACSITVTSVPKDTFDKIKHSYQLLRSHYVHGHGF